MAALLDFGEKAVKDVETKLQILKFDYSWAEEVEKHERMMEEEKKSAATSKSKKCQQGRGEEKKNTSKKRENKKARKKRRGSRREPQQRGEDQKHTGKERDSVHRNPQLTTGEVTTGEVTTGQVTTGQVTTGLVTTGQVTTGEVTTGQVTTGLVTTGQVTTGQVTTEVATGEVTTGEETIDAGELDSAHEMNSAKGPIMKQADESLHREIKDHEEVKEIVEDNIGTVNEACNNSDAIVDREQEFQKGDLEPSRDDNVVDDDDDDDDGFFPRTLFLFKIDRFKQKEEGLCNADLGSCNVASPTRRLDCLHSDDATVAAMKDEMTRKIRKFFGFK